ncbi:MAG: hypothetical protein A2X94_10435 [Bdellovibrionales bacterium GWB1_55_8]|nr:MAG: hypothetical protein A2X94_10435 [Bdellovibrionales bacterium GWB1_55_8]
MKKLPLAVVAAATFAIGLNAFADLNVVECRFKLKGKGGGTCRASIIPCSFSEQPSGSMSCDSGYRVVCDGETIINGAYTSGWTISPLASMCPTCVEMDLHDKGATIVIGRKPRTPGGTLFPVYPILKYDATDHISEFEEADARLYFESHGEPLRGTCSLRDFTPQPPSV